MNKIYIYLILSFLIFNTSCDNTEKLTDVPNSGWIEVLPVDDENGDEAFYARTVMDLNEEFSFDIFLNSATNVNGIKVDYIVELIGGSLDDTSVLGLKSTFIEKDSKNGKVTFTPVMSSKPYVLKFTLDATDDPNFLIGLSDGSQPTEFIVYVDKFFNASPSAFNVSAPAYTTSLGAIIDSVNDFTVESLWGPDFVAFATGNPAYSGMFLNSGTLNIDPTDNSISVSGDFVASTGSTGVYDPSLNTYTYTFFEANLFAAGFQVDNVLSPL